MATILQSYDLHLVRTVQQPEQVIEQRTVTTVCEQRIIYGFDIRLFDDVGAFDEAEILAWCCGPFDVDCMLG